MAWRISIKYKGLMTCSTHRHYGDEVPFTHNSFLHLAPSPTTLVHYSLTLKSKLTVTPHRPISIPRMDQRKTVRNTVLVPLGPAYPTFRVINPMVRSTRVSSWTQTHVCSFYAKRICRFPSLPLNGKEEREREGNAFS